MIRLLKFLGPSAKLGPRPGSTTDNTKTPLFSVNSSLLNVTKALFIVLKARDVLKLVLVY